MEIEKLLSIEKDFPQKTSDPIGALEVKLEIMTDKPTEKFHFQYNMTLLRYVPCQPENLSPEKNAERRRGAMT